VRIVAATNRDLEEAVKEGSFREDLFYRLNVIPINVPPLRERKGDIPLLIDHFMVRFSKVCKRPPLRIQRAALEALVAYDWPGNVRELENIVERLIVLTEGDSVGLEDLPERISRSSPVKESSREPVTTGALHRNPAHDEREGAKNTFHLPEGGVLLPELIREIEMDLIGQALDRTGGVKTKAARLLGLKRTTLIEKMKKFGML